MFVDLEKSVQYLMIKAKLPYQSINFGTFMWKRPYNIINMAKLLIFLKGLSSVLAEIQPVSDASAWPN